METKLRRMTDESTEEYIYRLCRNKDIGIYNLTWDEVGEVLNRELDLNYTESKYRKEYQSMQRGIDMMMNKKANLKNQMEEMKLLKLELEMERKKKQSESVYYNRLLREHSREEMLYDRVVDAIKQVETTIPKFEPLHTQKTNEEWLLGIADIHAYKYFESITNKYNKEILENRLNKLLGEIVYQIKINNIGKLTILNCADSLEGMIRKSQLQALELGLIESVVEFQRWLLEWLNQLSKYVEIRYIHLISSNHTEIRPFNTRAGQFPKEDLEIVIANYIKDMCKNNERIQVVVPEYDFALFDIAGYKAIANHGHKVRRNMRRYIERMSRKLRIFIDYGFFAHFHNETIQTIDEGIDNDCEIIRIPSIIGTDNFADGILEGAKSSALLLKFEEGKGRTQENKFILN